MANIPDSSLKTWNDGDVVHASDYSQDRSILQTAINDNYAKLILKYDKTDVDNLLNAMRGTGWTTQTIKDNWDLIQSIQTDVDNLNTKTVRISPDGEDYTGTWYNMKPSQIATSTVNWYYKSWTATDNQSVFQLTGSDTLYTPGSETTWVEVGGVPQAVGQGYTETDNKTITLAEGVPAGTLVELRYFLNNAASETPITNMVGYQENVATPLADIATNVKNYGAKGDGTTDDTTSIQNALNSLTSGGILFFPKGNYLVSNSFNIPSNTTIFGVYGKSRIFRQDKGFYIFNLQANSNILIENLVLDAGIPTADSGGADEQKHTVVVSGAKDSILRNLQVYNSGGDGIYVGPDSSANPSDNILIESCIINQVGRNGISLTGASHCKVVKCKISGARGPIVGVGIDIEPNAGDTCIGNQLINNILTNNVYGVTIPVTNSSNDRTTFGHVVKGNLAYGNQIGLQYAGIDCSYIENVIVRNENIGLNIVGALKGTFISNYIEDNGTLVQSNGQVNITNSTNILFTNNRVAVSNPSVTSNAYNLYVSGTSAECTISLNSLSTIKTGGHALGKFESGVNYYFLNHTSDDGIGTKNDSAFQFNIQDALQTWQYGLNFYKGNGTGNFSFRKGTPSSYTEILGIDNNGNVTAGGLRLNAGISGSTANRPTSGYIGMPYFDASLGKPIWMKTTSPVAWVDATGATV